jgi:hypothetical protein
MPRGTFELELGFPTTDVPEERTRISPISGSTMGAESQQFAVFRKDASVHVVN